MPLYVEIANAELAKTTLTCSFVPLRFKISTNIFAASFIEFPPKIDCCEILFRPKSAGLKIKSLLFVETFV